MKIKHSLDFPIVNANQERDVHLVLKLQAPFREPSPREPIALTLVLDRSGSMGGHPIEQARKACKQVIQNLRKDDHFSLVVFDDVADVVVPHGRFGNYNNEDLLERISRIHSRGCTNLTGGWEAAQSEIQNTPAGIPRRILLLTDGLLNRGITEPGHVLEKMTAGLTKHGIRTSCLGFGDHYDEEILSDIANATHGSFYDVKTEDNLPGIFKKELEGLLEVSVQNIQAKVKSSKQVLSWRTIDAIPRNEINGKTAKLSIGDLQSEEERVVTFRISTKRLKLPKPDKKDPKLLTIEFSYDIIGQEDVANKHKRKIARVGVTNDPTEVRVNRSILGPLSTQIAGLAIRESHDLQERGQQDEARNQLLKAIEVLNSYGDASTQEAIDSLHHILRRLETWTARDKKMALYASRSYRQHRTKEAWTSEDMMKPLFKQ